MESVHDFKIAPWDHELLGKCSVGVLACEFTRRPAGCFVLAAGRRRNSQPGRLRYVGGTRH